MTRDTVAPDDAFLFEFFQAVHVIGQILVPFRGLDAMQQNKINVIGAQFFQKARNDNISVWTFGLGNGGAFVPPNLADDDIILAWNAFQSGNEIGMRPVHVGKIKDAHAALVGALDEGLEFFLAHAGLIGSTAAAFDTRA